MEPPEILPTAVIVDVDGTLCDVRDIRHHLSLPKRDFDAFHAASADCLPNQQAIDYVNRAHADGHVVLIFTARQEKWRELTETWLGAHMPVPWLGPAMRPDKVYDADTLIKSRMHAAAAAHFDIVGAIDDNPKIIELWESLGIPTEVVPGWT